MQSSLDRGSEWTTSDKFNLGPCRVAGNRKNKSHSKRAQRASKQMSSTKRFLYATEVCTSKHWTPPHVCVGGSSTHTPTKKNQKYRATPAIEKKTNETASLGSIEAHRTARQKKKRLAVRKYYADGAYIGSTATVSTVRNVRGANTVHVLEMKTDPAQTPQSTA